MEKLNVWIHCRVLTKSNMNLLNFQEQILIDTAKENNMRIIGITKEVHHGKNINTYAFDRIINYIKHGRSDIVLVYSKKRISICEDVVEEFTMLCEQYRVRIISLQELRTNFLFRAMEL